MIKFNDENLLKGKKTQFSGERAVINGRKGGVQLGINNAKRKAFREYIESELDKLVEINGVTITVKEAMCFKLVRMILDNGISDKDFLKAFEFVQASIGEQPIKKYEVSEVSQEAIDEIEQLVAEYESRYNK